MENQVLVVMLKADMPSSQILELMGRIESLPGVSIVRTFERVLADALPTHVDPRKCPKCGGLVPANCSCP